MINDFVSKDQKEIQLIVFQLAGEEYAVPITCVQEIIMVQTPTRIPKSPDFVEGVINLRGQVIPIIDGRKKFMLETKDYKSSSDSRIMVLDINSETLGLTVDSVSEVIHLKTENIEPPPIDMGADSDFLWGVGKFQNRLLILLNPQRFLETGDYKKLAKLTQAISKNKDAAEEAEVKAE